MDRVSVKDPFPQELVNDREFAKLVDNMCLRPQMYVSPATLSTVCAFLDGYNQARSGGLLAGLREWLVVRHEGWNNLSWAGIVSRRLGSSKVALDDKDGQKKLIQELGRLLGEFFEYRRTVGLTKLYHDYGEWLLRQEWYYGPLRET